MACSFRGAGSPSYSLEIQWWYIKDHRDWQEKPAQITNNVRREGKQVLVQLPGGTWKTPLINYTKLNLKIDIDFISKQYIHIFVLGAK